MDIWTEGGYKSMYLICHFKLTTNKRERYMLIIKCSAEIIFHILAEISDSVSETHATVHLQ